MSVEAKLRALAEKWANVPAGERANYQLYLIDLAKALDVPEPQPRGSGYEFELPIKMVMLDGTTTTRFADLIRRDHFLLEAKDEEAGRSTDVLLRAAFGQAVQYSAHLQGGHPPYLMVLDVGSTLLVWDRWNGTYGGYQAAKRIDLRTLHDRPDDIALLRDIWLNPAARDPRAKANKVTQEIATHLAELASSLEARGYANERVAKFLMRCVFTMFSEDIGLLTDEPFKGAVVLGLQNPDDFASATEELWAAMDEGKRFGLKKLLRFNGHFFKEREVLPLTREDMVVVQEAAKADWSEVEPTIFGTLLTRALDADERHRLGAEYTPRDYVARLVRPTIEEPVREEWALVQAEVLQLRERGRPVDQKRAVARLREFHERLRSIKVLDPACGSGNFLYVALATLKEVELEVFREIESFTRMPEIPLGEVDPSQFYGIEVKPWARELAELTLWVGYYQWWRRTHGHTLPPEPVLRDTGTIELGDAILRWNERVAIPDRSIPDPTPRIPHPVTTELVPDPDARLPYLEYVGARRAEWPHADFIVGNPPYMGNKRMRAAFGDDYVDALRSVYDDVTETADYVMYWWHRAAEEVAKGRARRAGLITTNSITQTFNRPVVAKAASAGAGVTFAIPTHPWVDETGNAAVRVAMTVIAKDPTRAVLVHVDEDAAVASQRDLERLNADLTAGVDVATAGGRSLVSNAGLSSRGFTLVGRGFVLKAEEAGELRQRVPDSAHLIRPYVNGRDLMAKTRGAFVIDFGMSSEAEARTHAVLFDLVRNRVKPQRDANKRATYRDYWWRFGEPRVTLREALDRLPRYIATPYVSRHRIFVFLGADVAPDEKVVCIASPEPFVLGVLSSRLHAEWALAAGSRLGIGNDPTYNNSLCFDSFPLPEASPELRSRIENAAMRIHEHRDNALTSGTGVTMTAMYNVVEKLKTGEALSDDDREVHEAAACGVLRDLHDELDQLVAEAYGWPADLETQEILGRLVALHDARLIEEVRGDVHWIRPEFQAPRFAPSVTSTTGDLGLLLGTEEEPAIEVHDWPASVTDQLAMIRDILRVRPRDVIGLSRVIRGATRPQIAQHLDALTVLGVVRRDDAATYYVVEAPAVAA